ncbi:hypothetical protein QBC44DRAFT_374284 [Cladorrhinum sp. PSN332]|nr:hypothetical protein QBC44DRAFT_374284 [Cladorrhinum sp. PSN332]
MVLIDLLSRAISQAFLQLYKTTIGRAFHTNAPSLPTTSPAAKGHKIVLGSQNWFPVLAASILIHGPPVALGALLIYINNQRWYWAPEIQKTDPEGHERKMETNRNLLQLAAKVFKIMVTASVGFMNIKTFKHRLVESHLPLGLLSAPYRIGDVPYLWSPSFVRSTLFSKKPSLHTFGNSSSPQYYFGDSDGAGIRDPDAPFFYNEAPNKTWPLVLGAEAAPEICLTEFAVYEDYCLSGGFPDIYKWINGWDGSYLTNPIELSEPTGAVHPAAVGPAIKILDSWVPMLDPGNVDFGHTHSTTNGTANDRADDTGSSTTYSSSRLATLLEAAMITVNDHDRAQPVFNPGSASLAAIDPYTDLDVAADALRVILGAVFTDAIARTGSDEGSYASGLKANGFDFDWSSEGSGFDGGGWNPSNGIALASNLSTITQGGFISALAQGTTQFEFEAKRYGYGSGKGGPTMDFAIAVVYVYILSVVIYHLHVALSSWRIGNF